MSGLAIRYKRVIWAIRLLVKIIAIGTALVGVLTVAGFCWLIFSSPSPIAEISVSEADNTRLEVYRHWTGGFSGWQHDEYLVYYVRSGGWTGSDQKKLLPSGETAYSGDVVKFRRINATTIELIKANAFAGKDTVVLGRYAADGYAL